MSTDPDSKDLQINPNPEITQTGDVTFQIRHLIWRPRAGRDWSHPLYVECNFCNKEIKIVLRSPMNTPQFVLEAAKRVGRLAYLRTEHGSRKSN